jgi:hypothetical protein
MQIKPSTETKSAASTASAANTIPAHVIERMEAEWRQMRQAGSSGSSK